MPGAIIIVADPDLDLKASVSVLEDLYHLTHQEARLAARFFETTSLKDAAEQIGVSEGSARQYLKHVFEKTDTHSQAALMKLLARLATAPAL